MKTKLLSEVDNIQENKSMASIKMINDLSNCIINNQTIKITYDDFDYRIIPKQLSVNCNGFVLQGTDTKGQNKTFNVEKINEFKLL